MRVRYLSAVLGSLALMASSVVPARAGFPGCNGWIAFDSSPNGGELARDIFVTRQVPGATQEDPPTWTTLRLTNDPFEPATSRARDHYAAVSANGKEVAFSSSRNTAEFPNPIVGTRTEPDTEIYVMDAADDDGDGWGDNLRRLTDNAAIDVQVTWSPDSRKIAFASNSANLGVNTPTDLWVMDADGAEPPIRLPRDPAQTTVQHPVFSPDGEWIAYIGSTLEPAVDGELFMTRADGSDEVHEIIQLTDVDGAGSTHPDFSPDGTLLVFVSNRDDGDADNEPELENDLWVMTVPGADGAAGATNLTDDMRDAVSGEETSERIPAWSPDGTQIAFWAGLGTGAFLTHRPAIWTMSATGEDKSTIPLLPENRTPARPDWGPASIGPHSECNPSPA